MKRASYWAAANTAFVLSVYYGFIADVEGARSLVYAWIALGVLVAAVCCSDADCIKSAQIPRAVPNWLSMPVRIAVIVFFIWNSAWFCATFYSLAVALSNGARIKGERLIAEQAL